MSMSRWALAGVVLSLVLVTSPHAARAEEAAEQMDNPAFAAWSKFAIGSSETLTAELQGANPQAAKMTMEMVRKLVEKADDHITIEVTSTINVAGQKKEMPSRNQNVPAKMAKKDVKSSGTEEVEAAGKKYTCKVYDVKGFSAQNPDATVKLWVNDDIPGGLVKMEAQSPRGTMTSLLKSFETK
jgi:hypothetical protein